MIGKKINQLATELAPESTDLTIIGDPITGVSKKITIAQLGAIFSGAVSFYTNLAAFPVTGDINVIYCAKDTQKLYLWSGSAYVEVFPSQALLDTYQLRSEKGNANGYASLDSLGKVPISQLPSSIMEYKGTWNAATNTPTLANGTGDTGDVYICNVAGTVNFGAGPITFAVGDYVIYSGTIWQRSSGAVGTVTSVAASITGNSVSISGSPIVTSGTLAFSFAGNATQYVRGDGQLATLPTNGGGGGASVSYYLNGSINQGTIGGVTYYEMNKTPIIGAGTDFTTSSNGYIASFLTDANDPALLNIPAGNFNFETYFEASSGGGSPTFYIELYKYDGTTFTLIASNSGSPKLINDGTNVEAYFSALAVPQTTLTLTDRLAIRIYVTTAGRTITLHTENGHLCQVITTFTTGLTALNGLTSQVQYLATGTSGTDFNIASASATHTFNLPTASATNRGALSSADWTTFNNKQNALTLTTTGSSGDATLVGATLNIPNYGSALTGYVPYTGATGNVNLGTNDFLTRSVFIEGATNYQTGLLMKQYSVYNFVTGAYTQIAPSTATELNIVHNQANTTRRRYALSVAALQDGDTFQYLVPRASGTLALTSDLTGGTVTSVAALTIGTSGTDLSSTVANGTTTPVITLNVPTASATNRGALSSTDWTTFNNKQNALTNPVTGTGTNNYIPKFTTTGSTIGNSVIYDNSGNIGIGETNANTLLSLVGSHVGGQSILKIQSSTAYSSSGLSSIGFNDSDGSRKAIIYTNTNGLQLETNTATPIIFNPNGTTALTLANGGAATFSSSVTATGYNVANTGGSIQTVDAGAYVSLFGATGSPANTLIFGTNNAPRMTISSTGNLELGGTGFSSPSGADRFIGVYGAQDCSLILQDAVQLWELYVNDDFYISSGSTSRLSINRTSGAATFSSSVSVKSPSTSSNSFTANYSNSNQMFQLFEFASGIDAELNLRNSAGTSINRLSTNGNSYFNGGNVGIGTALPSGRLHAVAVDATSSNNVIYLENSASTVLLRIRNDGAFFTGTASSSPYNNTTASLANLIVTSAGSLERSTASSQRFKDNIQDWNGNGLNTILALKPRTFKYKKDYYDKADIQFLGLIAEEVAEVSTFLADYENEDRTGQVENVRYANIVVPLIKAIQELKAELDTLKNK